MITLSGRRLWLKVRIGKGLSTEKKKLIVNFLNKEVTITSEVSSESLSEASWLVFGARGFANEQAARTFGETLREAVALAGLCAQVAIDALPSGDDRKRGGFNEEWARAEGFLKPNERYAPDVHGILIMPDDDNTLFPTARASVSVTSDPMQFLKAIEEAGHGGAKPDIQKAVRLLNLSLINDDRIAKTVLSISAIESLAGNPSWTDHQRRMLRQLEEHLQATQRNDEEQIEVLEAIRRLHRVSVRQSVKRLLEANDLLQLWGEWDEVYGHRSRLFHGGADMERAGLNDLSTRATRLCGRIVLEIARRQGVSIPVVAHMHFHLDAR